MRYVPLVAVAPLAGFSQTLASGDEGQLTVCEIACRLTQLDTCATIRKLSRTDTGFDTFLRARVYFDDPRKRRTGMLHPSLAGENPETKECPIVDANVLTATLMDTGGVRLSRQSVAGQCSDQLKSSFVTSSASSAAAAHS